jgi:cell wall-associated NlpC family hydrolase
MIDYGVIILPVIPMRESASHKSEMISQLIFAESVVVINETLDWVFVRNFADNYEGWIERKQLFIISELEFDRWNQLQKQTIGNTTETIFCENSKTSISLPAGAKIPFEFTFEIGSLSFSHSLSIEPQTELSAISKKFLNAPYLWGGKSFMGFDCSGFTQTVFKIINIDLPRDASQQADEGLVVDFLEEVQSGDLAFFHNAEGKITHVGILLSPSEIIHCSGSVKIDIIDHHGIFNQTSGTYTHELRVIKRIR